MNKKLLPIVFFLWLIPCVSLASDLNKGLSDPANSIEKQNFLKEGADLTIVPADVYPVPIFMLDTGRSIDFSFNTDKSQYQAGEEVKMRISAESHSFLKPGLSPGGKKIFYLWTTGNFDVEIYRLSDEVKDGEFLAASGKVYPDDKITLLQNEKKDFDFSWRIPGNAKKGNYEIRVYPTSAGILFRGSPEAYRSLTKTRITIGGDEAEDQSAGWDVGAMKIGEEPLKLKNKVLHLEAKEDHMLTIPLKNHGSARKEISIVKQVIRMAPDYGGIVSEEEEKLSLEPGEEKIVPYKLETGNIKGEPAVLVRFSFSEAGGKSLPQGINYFNYPLAPVGDESVIIPLFFKNNLKYTIYGMGINTVKDTPGFVKDSYFTPFLEVRRFDPLFYYSQERERVAEDNLKLDLILLDESGNKVDGLGYAGPSWDRSGQISKLVQLKKDYNYLKLVAVLSSQKNGEIERKELEYYAPLPAKSWFDRIKELGENKIIWSLVIAAVLLAAAVSAAVILVRRRRRNLAEAAVQNQNQKF